MKETKNIIRLIIISIMMMPPFLFITLIYIYFKRQK